MVDDRLGPDHVCRRDDPSYPTVGAWYEAHQGRVPIQAAHALSKLTRDGRMSFAEAFRTLVDRGALILIEDEPSDAITPAGGLPGSRRNRDRSS